MSDFNWCHGPQCHEKHTVDRVRGVKGSKVLRTRKIKINGWNSGGQWGFFCSNHCQNDFWSKHARDIVAIAPRTECLETPIEVEVVNRTDWRGQPYATKEIKVDETRQID